MYDLLYDPPVKLMMLGGCSIVSSTIGEAAKMWNLIVVRSDIIGGLDRTGIRDNTEWSWRNDLNRNYLSSEGILWIFESGSVEQKTFPHVLPHSSICHDSQSDTNQTLQYV